MPNFLEDAFKRYFVCIRTNSNGSVFFPVQTEMDGMIKKLGMA